MNLSKLCLWVLLLLSLVCNTSLHAQNVTGNLSFNVGTDEVCQGSLIELVLDVDPPSNSYNYNWTLNNQQIRDNSQNPGTGSGPGNDFSFLRISLSEPGTNTISVQVRGETFTQVIEVSRNPVAGSGIPKFLCNVTAAFPLFDLIEGGDTGGTWTYKDDNGDIQTDSDGIFEMNDEPNVYTYTVASSNPVCEPSVTDVKIQACSDPDYDDDGEPNETDLDNDNDGIPDLLENTICSVEGFPLSPSQPSVDEDFGVGPPTQNSFVSDVLGYEPGWPDDQGNNGEYNVATSLDVFNFDGVDPIWITTNLNSHFDGDDTQEGRFLIVNMRTSLFNDAEPIYEQTNVPVTPGVEHLLSMKLVNTNDQGGAEPDLIVRVVNQANGDVVAETNNIALPFNNDIWQESPPLRFTPQDGVTIVSVQVINKLVDPYNPDPQGNDVGIDNILLSREECDFDGDGIPNYLDLDSDNDGIYDAIEAGIDPSLVGTDGRVIGTLTRGMSINAINTLPNSNSTGFPDFVNYDSDGDGCSDANEAYNDSLADGGEGEEFGGIPIDPTDIVNLDGKVLSASYVLPEDIDGDSVSDYTEAGPDLNGNSIPDVCDDTADNDEDLVDDEIDLDDDNDGVLDEDEYAAGLNPLDDDDTDGILNFLDPDLAVDYDTDGDGIPNQFDVDSDNDGVYDHVEAGLALIIITVEEDYGQIGLDTDVETVDTTRLGLLPGAGLTSDDFDSDGLPNFLDIDADGDGILDNYEAQSTTGYIVPSNVDANENGADDAYEGANALNPIDTLPTDTPDYLNENSDDDCLADTIEAYDIDQDGVSDITETVDANGDGLNDVYEGAPLIAAFPDNHNPGGEIDYREVFEEVIEEVVTPQVLCQSEDPFRLFDLIDSLTTNENGTWEGELAADEAFDWELDPSLITVSGLYEYIYTLPVIGTCPESTFTITIQILEEPFVGDEDADGNVIVESTICETQFGGVKLSEFIQVGADENGTWESTNTSLPIPTTFDGPITIPDTFVVGDILDYTYTVGSGDCMAVAELALEVSIGRNAGRPTIDNFVCGSSISEDLNEFLTGEEQGGVWSSVDTTLINGSMIDPSSLGAGVFTFTYFLPPTDCQPATSDPVIVTILTVPDAGTDFTTEVCDATNTINLFDELIKGGGTPDETDSLNNEGIWTNANNGEIGVDHLGTIDVSTITTGDVFTYTVGPDTCNATATVTVNVTPGPDPGDSVIGLVYCGSNDEDIPLFPLLGGTPDTGGTWSDGTGIVNPSTLVAGDYTYTYTLTGVGSCTVTSSTVQFEITPELNAGTSGFTIQCKDPATSIDLFDILLLNGPADTGGTWTAASGAVVFTDDRGTLDFTDAAIFANVEDQDRYTYTISSDIIGGCDDVTSFIDLELSEDRDAGVSPATIVVCTADTSSIDLFSSLEAQVATDGSWTGDTNVDGGHLGTLLLNEDTEPGDFTFTYTLPAIGSCEADEVVVALTIVAVSVPTNPSEESICDGDVNPVLSVTVDPGLTANWYFGAEDGPLVQADSATYTSTETDAGGYTYFVKSFSSITNCESVDFVEVSFTIFGLPEVDLLPRERIVCEGDIIPIDSGLSDLNFDFQWSNANGLIAGATGATLDVFEAGTYFVEYTDKNFETSIGGSCSATSSSTIVNLIKPPENIVLTPSNGGFSNSTSITVTFDEDPLGDYEYTLDGLAPQSSNVFNNVGPGDHDVTVRDLNGCGEIFDEIFVIGFPQFFSPNGDGIFDTWNIQLDPSEPMDVNIFVFDRYGKLLAQVFPNGSGWDGTFVGKNMPSDDYWFTATNNDTGETFSSHFTLIR